MSVWYALSGSVQVKNDPEVEKIVDAYNDMNAEMNAEIIETDDPEIVVVEFSGGAFMNHATTSEIDAAAQRLGPYATGPQFLDWDHENEPGRLYIGPPDQEDTAKSFDTLEEINGLLAYLTASDRAKLIATLQAIDTAQVGTTT